MKKLAFIVLLLGSVTVSPAQTAGTAAPGELEAQVRRLEQQVEEMRAEIAKLKQSLPSQAPDAAPVPEQLSAARPVPANEKAEPVPKQEKKQIGIDLGRDVRLIPYGTIYFNAFGNSGGTNNTDVPLWATPSGTGNVSASARQTRFGARIEGARVGQANLIAVIEADFYGGFPAIGVGENFGVVRLRLATAKLSWERTSMTIGQDWAVFAPLSPASLAAAAIPQMAAAGNPWSRLPQVRLERRFAGNRVVWQGAVLAPQTGDFPSGVNSPALLQPGSGAASRVPFLESRLSYGDQNWFGPKRGGTIAVSGHYGRSRIITGTPSVKHDIDSVGIAVDWNLAFAPRFNIAGEAFFGRNLAGFQAGVFQGYNTDFANRQGAMLIPGGVRAIGTRGGWTQISFTPNVLGDRLTVYGSIGLDDPRDRDLASVAARDWRVRNLATAFNFIFKPIPQLSFGAEYRRLETTYSGSGKRIANHFNFAATHSF